MPALSARTLVLGESTLVARDFITQHPYVALAVTQKDLLLATAAFGWTIGFSMIVLWTLLKQTRRLSVYIVMCWSEFAVCAAFAIICWLYLFGVIPHSFAFFFSILTCWALQVQLLLQIIVNRICVLIPIQSDKRRWKASVAIIITAVNISVYCIWIPAKLQINDRYHWTNIWWDRCEKCIYLLVDAVLNYFFIRTVKKRLLDLGLRKYDPLVAFNTKIIWLSLSMDVLIIAMMSYQNDFVYMQFHPVAYLVKLQIEMTMSNLIVKIARSSDHTYDDDREMATFSSGSNAIASGSNSDKGIGPRIRLFIEARARRGSKGPTSPIRVRPRGRASSCGTTSIPVRLHEIRQESSSFKRRPSALETPDTSFKREVFAEELQTPVKGNKHVPEGND